MVKSRYQPISYSNWVETTLVFLADLCGTLLSIFYIGINFSFASQVVSDHRIHIGKLERWILLDNLFCGSTLQEGGDDSIQGDASVADQNDAILI